MKIGLSGREDAEEIFTLQQLAYQSEARLYRDWNIPPLRESVDALRAEFDRQVFFKALDGDPERVVGSVRARVEAGTCFVGRLIVHPDFQGRGIGTALLCECECRVCNVARFELFTGSESSRNLALYTRLGYTPFRQERISERVTLLFLEKRVDLA